ncbi:PRC and DUF2382 domain-containing protein [Arthrobacter sp. Br18]|uniref:DUF2382 domain-containing protein n=1 Tax=Arthrobacter sp. Br18 TaxID=1312954 RepID=UPI000478EFAD|nr:PRC and DUF2382 domain-containing protein [Arthrobacter sp. Br18]
MITQDNVDALLRGHGKVFSSDGEKIGSIGQIYVDDGTDQASWVTVSTGLFGTSETFIPLEGAALEGKDLRVAYPREQVKDAPKVDRDGHLSPEEEHLLHRHYGLGGSPSESPGRESTGSAETGHHGTGTAGPGTPDTGVSGPPTDRAMTLSEEQLKVGVEQYEAGRVRLRKYVVTETVTRTVPVSREELRIEREPIPKAGRRKSSRNAELSEEVYEITLHEQRAVVGKETVPVERIRLIKETVTSSETVTGELRKERLETDGIDGAGPGSR